MAASSPAKVAALPTVAAGWAGSAEAARPMSRLARGPDSRQPRAAKRWRSSVGSVPAMRAGDQPSASNPTTTRPALVSKGLLSTGMIPACLWLAENPGHRQSTSAPAC